VPNLRNIPSWLKAYYDKVIALLLVVVLLVSLLYLAFNVGTVQRRQLQFIRKIDGMKPKHETTTPVDVSSYQTAIVEIAAPFQIGAWSNALFVPEARVTCVDCRLPIPHEAAVCPFCEHEQPMNIEDDPQRDLDGDGMKDVWEIEHGLNPHDAADASLDVDSDGFTNIEEYGAGTAPDNVDDFPPIVAKLRVVRVDADPFKLRFKSVFVLPDDSLKFQINTRGNVRTYFKKLEEEAEGFRLVKYEEKSEEKLTGSMRREVDVSILTLQRGDKLIPLVRGQDVQYNEYTALLVFLVDQSEYTVRIDSELEFNRKKYKVMAIDSRRESVVLRRLSDDKDLVIEKLSAQ